MRHFLLLLLCALPLMAGAQTLTEAEALRLGLSRTELHDLERGTRALAEADATASRIWANPTLDYERERMGPSGTDETWKIAQTFDLSGRRGLRQDAAERRLDAANAHNTARRGGLTVEISRQFHDALLGQKLVQATEVWVRRFVLIESRIEKQAKAGEASGYDRRRLARERQTAEARLAAEQAKLLRQRERLAALIDRPVQELSGSLLPPALPALDAALGKLEQRPELQILARRCEAAELENRAAARGWAPDVTLGVGTKKSDYGFTTDHGAIVSVSVPLPVFDRQQAGEQRAAAEAMVARAEWGLAKHRMEGELRGLHRQTERLTATAADYRARAVAAMPELLRIAEAAYQGGESTLLELLDAYRGALETETTALDLEWQARAARIDYDLLTGSIPE